MQPNLFDGIAWYIVLLYSTVFHEAAHAWVSYKLGDDTAYRGGQVSLDPIPHIVREPIGMIVVPLVSYLSNGWMMGWASAPYDPHWALQYPKRSALMAMAGPAANGILATIAFILLALGARAGLFFPSLTGQMSGAWGVVGSVLFIAFMLNSVLMFYNLLPLPPLDGSAIPLFFLKGSKAEEYQHFIWQPQVAMVGMLIAFYFGGGVVSPLFIKLYGLLIHVIAT